MTKPLRSSPNPPPDARSAIIECHACGYEPPDQIKLPRGCCPKCKGNAWERLPVPPPKRSPA